MLNRDAIRGSPQLLLILQQSTNITASQISVRSVDFPAVIDHILNLTVIFDPLTYLPYLVRAYEDHAIFGPSTNDLVLYNYTVVEGVSFPRRIKIMYNEQNMLFDTIIGDIEVNPTFPPNYFDGVSVSEINSTEAQLPPTKPMPSVEYGDAEVTEFR